MVAATGMNGGGEHSRTIKSVGLRNFKIYAESEGVKDDSKIIGRKSVTVNKGANLTTAQGGLNNMEKSKGKVVATASKIVRRKALADVSNAQVNSSRNVVRDVPKLMKGKSEGTTCLRRVSLGPSRSIVNVSLRKSFVEKVQENVSHGVGDVHTSKKDGNRNKTMGQSHVVTNGRITTRNSLLSNRKSLPVLKRVNQTNTNPSSNGNRNKTMGQSHVVTNGRITARNSLLSNRKSLPVLKRVNQTNTSIPKENDGSSEKRREKSGFLVGKAGKKVASRVNSGRSHLWKNRASDGFIIMGKTNVEARALPGKSIRPILKTTLQATQAHRTSKSKNTSDLNKQRSVAAISSKNKEVAVASSLPENIAIVIPHEAAQGQLSSDADANPGTISDITSRRKSDRRKSYTSSLMARSKLLEKCGEVMQLEKLPSIDDYRNQLEVAEYVDEIYQYYWVTEFNDHQGVSSVKIKKYALKYSSAQNVTLANYMSIQTNITAHMRGILINWLIEVHFKFDLMQETLYLMVALLDRYLSQATIKKNELQLVGLTALLLASKYEDFWHPRVKDLVSISAESYTRDQMLTMERLVLKQLKFRLNVATPYVFMLRFLKASQSDTKLEHLAFYLIELCLVEYEALKFKPSLLCASAIYVARFTLHMTPWTPLLCKHSRYEESQLRDCGEMILRFHKAAGTEHLRVTYEKYTRPYLSCVAAITALDRLPL